jgi:transposase InsO family protein
MQWYWGETGENVVHSFSQAAQKRGLPGAAYSDRGKAELCGEFRSGLARLGVLDQHTRGYSPHMNGKCEHVWSRLEGRLINLLAGQKDLTLKRLNDLTQAWAEMEYNRTFHREIGETPLARYLRIKDVSKPCPSAEELRLTFCIEVARKQRRSDGTISLEGRRYEIPSRFRTQETLHIKYARWDLNYVHIIDPRTGLAIARIFPIDKNANADGRRRVIEDPAPIQPVIETTVLPPLLRKLWEDYSESGFLPAYKPKDEINSSIKETSHDNQ